MKSLLRAVVLASTLVVSEASLAESGTFEDLGVQLTSMTLQGTAFTKDLIGRDLVCAVIRGAPAKLVVADVASGEMLHRFALEGANGAWNATTASDGSVYVGTDDNGHLYRWIPGEDAVHDLGQVAPKQTFAWDVVGGADGEVFVGTYPGCMVVRYHPKDGFRDVGKGAVAPGENYVRGIAFDPATGKVYPGVGTRAHVIEVDPKTAAKRDVLPEKFRDKKFAYSVEVREGKLFAMLTDGQDCPVIDLASGEVEATIPRISGQLVASQKQAGSDTIYLNSDGKIVAYDLKTKQTKDVAALAGIIGMAWVGPEAQRSLAVLTARGQLLRFRSGAMDKPDTLRLKVPPEPTPIQSICKGPDGKIYSGGYLVGGLAAFDPKTGKSEQLGRVSQPESMGVMRGKLYLGIYPRARLVVFDPTQKFDGSTNPRQFEELDRFDQDRPFGTLGVDALNKVFFGTVSDYGTLGGALSVYDAGTDKVEVFRNVVPQQSVVSLAWANDLVVGGTTLSGGLGIEPTAKEAELFLFDPKTNQRVFNTTPVPGAWIISALINGPDGNVWGVADTTLFGFDVKARKVTFTKPLFAGDASTQHHRWRDATLAIRPQDGLVYGTMGGKLFRLDPKTKEVEVLRDKGAVLLALDDDGRVYFRDRTNLWRYSP